jgi:RNA-directed DNA polymerase
MDNRFLELLRRFLKAGVEVEGVVLPTEKGVPQGGVISPLLANAVLNKLDWFLHGKGSHDKAMMRAATRREPNVRFVRYADDWCVFTTRASKQYAETLRDEISEFLRRECGLELSVEKTHVTHVRDGFDFLGFRLIHEVGRSGNSVPKIKVGLKALKNLRVRLDEAMRLRPQQESVALRVQRGSSVVRGWSEHFRIAHDFLRMAGTLDHQAFWTAVKAICRKFDITTAQCVRKYYRGGTIQVDESCRLETFSGKPMKLDYTGPEPYVPGGAEYETDDEMEADFARFNERTRLGSLDAKWQTLQRDQYRCRRCGAIVTDQTSQMDHLVPVKRFASFALATTDDNVQTLCLDCHREKHHAK